MKKAVCFILIMVFMFSIAGSCKAEGILNWLTNAWEDTSGWVEGAWKDATHWIDGAWGDASGWVEQAWNDSSAWVVDIWGDVSGWTVDTYNNVAGGLSAWWVETFDKVTDKSENAWDWFKASLPDLKDKIPDYLTQSINVILAEDDSSDDELYNTYLTVLKSFGIDDTGAMKVWETIMAYSVQKGFSAVKCAKIMLPYLLELRLTQIESADTAIPAIAISQYLTGIIEKLGIGSDDIAVQFIEKLDRIVSLI